MIVVWFKEQLSIFSHSVEVSDVAVKLAISLLMTLLSIISHGMEVSDVAVIASYHIAKDITVHHQSWNGG